MLLSVVVIACDGDYTYLDGCLKSIEKVVKVPHEVVIVNNCENIELPHYENVYTKGYNLNAFEGRRFGAQNAKGDYIWFIDADDEPTGEITSIPDADLIQFDFRVRSAPDHINFKMPFREVELKYLLETYANGVWCRFFRREFLLEVYKNIPQQVNLFVKEDLFLMKYVISANPTLAFINKPFYIYNIYLSAMSNKNKYSVDFYEKDRAVSVKKAPSASLKNKEHMNKRVSYTNKVGEITFTVYK